MTRSETAAGSPPALRGRYTVADLDVLSAEEARRFVRPDTEGPGTDVDLAWQLLYRREPELYDRLVAAEQLHPRLISWLPPWVERIVEVGAGTGRLTLDLVHRAGEVIAIEPAAPLRQILERKLSEVDHRARVQVTDGFFDDLRVSDHFADLVVACSVLTPAAEHGGEAGLGEMERVCRAGGKVVVVWPNSLAWLAEHGYRHVSFEGEMAMEFGTPQEAAEVTDVFYPHASAGVRRAGMRRVPYALVGINPPRDLAFKTILR